MDRLVIATRGSRLALWQAEHVRTRILAVRPEIDVSLLVIKTRGDKILDVPLAKVGGKGLFVKEIEEALLDGRADLAVHSMKDVPMDLPDGLILGAVLERHDPRDMLLSVRHPDLDSLPPGAVVGTSSLRRQAQLLAVRPDLTVTSLRGNVDTRLGKLLAGEFEAIVMAAAGMRRLGLSAPCMTEISPDHMLPAAGQGALGLEYREDRSEMAAVAAALDHRDSHLAVAAERGFLAGLDGGCQTPIAAQARLDKEFLVLEGLLMDVEGRRSCRKTLARPIPATPGEARRMGLELAATVKQAGGDKILAELYASPQDVLS